MTQCPVPVAIFCLFFTSQEINIKRSPNTANFLWILYGSEDIQWAKEAPGGVPRGGTTHQGALGGPGAPRWVVPTSVASRTPSLPYKIPNIPKPFWGSPRSEVLPLQGSVATKNQSRPHFGTLPEGEIITGGHLHHPGGHHDEEGVVHPRG